MRANPHLLEGHNKAWVKFFQLAVFATMYVRDHQRPAFHQALGMDPTDYDMEVFRITSAICEQVFPVTLDVDHPAFLRRLERLRQTSEKLGAAKAAGGIGGSIRRAALGVRAAAQFLHLLVLPGRKKPLPADVRMAPAW